MQSNTSPAADPAVGAPLRFSASRIERYITCPLQAKFRYLDKLPDPQNSAGSFGKVVHHALQKYNQTGDIEEAVVEFFHVWEHPELIEATPEKWTYGSSFGGYRKRGEDMLRAYHDAIKDEVRTVIATEHQFLVPFGDFELYGFVDLIELRHDEIHLVDYKTAKRLPKMSALPYHVQMTAYSYAAQQPEFWLGGEGADGKTTPAIDVLPWSKAKTLTVRPILYQLEQSRAIDAGVRGDDDLMRLYRVATEIDKAIKYDVYVPNLSGDSCGFCAYQEPCGLPIVDNRDQW